MTKSQLIQLFPKVSPTAIQERDEEYVIVGKFCIVAPLGNGEWDLWLCNPKDIARGLSTKKIGILREKLAQEGGFTVLNGEVYATLQGRDLIESNLDLLGVRKKRQYSEKHRQILSERLRKFRNAA